MLSSGLSICEGTHLQKLVEDCRRYRLDASAMTYERASSCQHLQPFPSIWGSFLYTKMRSAIASGGALRHTRV